MPSRPLNRLPLLSAVHVAHAICVPVVVLIPLHTTTSLLMAQASTGHLLAG